MQAHCPAGTDVNDCSSSSGASTPTPTPSGHSSGSGDGGGGSSGGTGNQDCTLNIYTHFTDAVVSALGGGSGDDATCEDDDLTASGKCMETLTSIYQLPSWPSQVGETVFNAAVKVASSGKYDSAAGLCDHYCSAACYGVGGFAMWFESPCIDPLKGDPDLANLLTLRFKCMPPWGLVILIGLLIAGVAVMAKQKKKKIMPAVTISSNLVANHHQLQMTQMDTQCSPTMVAQEPQIMMQVPTAEDPMRMTLGPLLEKANLTKYTNELLGMGAVVGEDLQHMTDAELSELGMEKLEITRLRCNLKK